MRGRPWGDGLLLPSQRRACHAGAAPRGRLSRGLLRAPSRRGHARRGRPRATQPAARRLTGRSGPLAGARRCLARGAPPDRSHAARRGRRGDRIRGDASRARGLSRHAGVPLRAVERGPHRRRRGRGNHLARGVATGRHGGGAPGDPRPVAGDPRLPDHADGESTRGPPPRIQRTRGQRSYHAWPARDIARYAARRFAALRSRPTRLDAGLPRCA